MNFLIRLLLLTLGVMLTAYLIPAGVEVDDFMTALLVAAFLSLLNVTLKPILIILTIPVTFFTFGLFLLVINAFMIMLADSVIDGFLVKGFWWAMFFSLILSIVTSIFEALSRKPAEEK